MTMEQLQTLRDDLKLKAHLFNAEMSQSWETIQKDWQLLQSESTKVGQPLLAQLENSLLAIRDGIERNHRKH